MYEFGAFLVDVDQRVVFKDGIPLHLRPKTIDLLLVLLENHGRIVTKEELLRAVWPDTFVEEGNLAWNVSALRRALTEGTDGKVFVETIPRRGYSSRQQTGACS